MRPELKGVIVPMVSPFNARGKLDEEAAGRLVGHVVSHGCHTFVPGSTGEALSITADDRLVYVKAAFRAIAGRGILYAGIAGTCLEETILAGKCYADEGAEILVANLPALKIVLEELNICGEHCITPCYPLDQEEKQNILRELRLIMEKIK